MNAASRRAARSRPRPRVESLETRQMLTAAAALDPSFGAGAGFVLGSEGATTPATQPDGKVVVAGVNTVNGESYLAVSRFEANGAVDPTFAGGGRAVLARFAPNPQGGTIGLGGGQVFLLPGGKILVTGIDTAPSTLPNQVVPTTIDREAVFRLDADGSLDTTFGTNGEVAYPEDLSSTFPHLAAAAVEPNGQIILAGVSGAFFPNDSGPDLVAVARLNADGSLDTTFGKGGIASTAVVINGYQVTHVSSVAVQADGQVVVAGSGVSSYQSSGANVSSTYEGFAVRFGAGGSLDTTFGGPSAGGQVLISPTPGQLSISSESAVAIQPDGKIVLGGTGGGQGLDVVTRLDADGTLDPTFGTAGQAFAPAEYHGGVNGVLVQADGKIVLSGDQSLLSILGSPGVVALLVRFNPDGSLDSAFGNTATPGVATYGLGGQFDATAASLQPNGRILLVGTFTPTPNDISPATAASTAAQTAVVRILPANSLPANRQPAADYDAGGKSDLAIYLPALGEFIVRPTAPGAADVTVPFGFAGAGQTLPAPGDYDGSGQAEIAAYLPSLGLYAYRPASGAPDVVEPFGFPGLGQDIPAPGDYTGTGKDDLAIYLPSIGAFAIRPANGGPDEIIPFGLAGPGASIPVPGDYDGSGKTELAVYLPSLGLFAYRPANGGADVIVPFGLAGAGQTLPAPGDYDGSGKTEVAAYLPSLGLFAYRPGNGGGDVVEPFGAAGTGSVPVPGDYTGSGHDDVAIFDPTSAVFAIRPAGGGADILTAFGIGGAGQTVPVAASPSLATSGTLSAKSITVGSAAPASSTPAVPSGPLGATPRRVGRGSVIAQSGTDLSGRPTG